MTGPHKIARLVTMAALLSLTLGACDEDPGAIASFEPSETTRPAPLDRSEEPLLFENELFELEIPASWNANEHSDTAGVDLISDEMRMTVTLFPVDLLGSLGLDVDSPVDGDALLGLAGIFSAGDGIELGEPEMVQVGTVEAVAVSAAGPGEAGESLIYEVGPGVLVFASGVAPSDQHENYAEAGRSVAASLQINGTVDELIEAVDAPPPLDFETI